MRQLKENNIKKWIRLITLLSQSLSEKSKRSDKVATRQFLDKYCGAWKGEASAKDIINAIRTDRISKEPIAFD